MTDYYWPEPDGDGWIDAWNGWYATQTEAIDAAQDGITGRTPPVLTYGEGLISETEYERRSNPDLIPTFNEDTLRDEIIDKWGPAGAHLDVYDTLLKHDRNAMKLLAEAIGLLARNPIPAAPVPPLNEDGQRRNALLAKYAEFLANPFMEV